MSQKNNNSNSHNSSNRSSYTRGSNSVHIKKKEVLSLIDDKKKPTKVKKNQNIEKKPSISEAKKSALNLFEKEDKKNNKNTSKHLKPEKETVENETKNVSKFAELAKSKLDEKDSISSQEEDNNTEKKEIIAKSPIIVKELADLMGVKSFNLIKSLMELEIYTSINQPIDSDIARRVCQKYGFIFKQEKRDKSRIKKKEKKNTKKAQFDKNSEFIQARAPIITFMGHVDHGKTSLLDYIRKTKVTSKESGGITQHIGAYRADHNGQKITFIDTPGHAAFTEMRSRGARVTDIVVLVIAADDGIMPQTKEALKHAQSADVEIIIAINKCDLPNADVNQVKSQLQEINLTPEDWGGNTIVVEVSAETGDGVDNLLEMMLLQSEVLELQANPKEIPEATVIEAKIEVGKGPTCSVIVLQGTLKVGQFFVCGKSFGKIKSLISDNGDKLKEAGPSVPVEIIGFDILPNVGETLRVINSEKEARKISKERKEQNRQEKLAKPKRTTLENILQNLDSSDTKTLNLIIKTDVQGSAEAIVGSLNEIESEKVKLNITLFSAGSISESDILLATATNSVIIGFNTKVENKAVAVAKNEGVQIKLYSIIYELIDQIKESMQGMLDPEIRENIIGKAKVKQVFKILKGKVAGCEVISGKVSKLLHARVLRDRQAVYDGKLSTLKRFQEEVKEVRNGLECGIKLGNFNDYEEGDIIECYELEKIKQYL